MRFLCFLAGLTAGLVVYAYGLWAGWSWAR